MLNNKRILVMMAHSDICPYDTFKTTFTNNPSLSHIDISFTIEIEGTITK